MFNDLKISIQRYALWLYLAKLDIKVRYRGSAIGPLWLFLSYTIFIVSTGFVYHEIFKVDLKTFMPYLAAGLLVWNLVSVILVDSPVVFTDNALYMQNMKLPLFLFIFRAIVKNLIVFLHQIPATIFILLVTQTPINIPLLFIGLILIIMISVFLIFLLALYGSRFRDITQIIPIFLQIGFLLTPILWSKELLKNRIWVYEWNPLYHVTSLVRDPLIGLTPSLTSYIFSLAILFVSMAFAYFAYNKHAKNVAIWLT